MYSLDCDYYKKKFETLEELIGDVIISGMDHHKEVTEDGIGICELALDFLSF